MLPSDKTKVIVWYNGVFVNWDEALIHLYTHSLHYSGAVFEGIRIYNTHPFKLQEHNRRLLLSAQAMGYDVPYTMDQLGDAVIKLIAKQELTEGYIRPIVWRGPEEYRISGNNCTIQTAIIALNNFAQERSKTYPDGLDLEIARWQKIPAQCVPVQSKASGLYMMATIIINEAKHRGFHDAIMLDQDGYITEATTSNCFLVKDNKLWTAPAECFLNGITRQTVIEIAMELDIPVVECKFTIEELNGASSMFLTGTAIEVMPVRSLYDYRSGITHKLQTDHDITKQIWLSYKKKVGCIV